VIDEFMFGMSLSHPIRRLTTAGEMNWKREKRRVRMPVQNRSAPIHRTANKQKCKKIV
jgi:hypothetical protein